MEKREQDLESDGCIQLPVGRDVVINNYYYDNGVADEVRDVRDDVNDLYTDVDRNTDRICDLEIGHQEQREEAAAQQQKQAELEKKVEELRKSTQENEMLKLKIVGEYNSEPFELEVKGGTTMGQLEDMIKEKLRVDGKSRARIISFSRGRGVKTMWTKVSKYKPLYFYKIQNGDRFDYTVKPY